MTSSTAKWNLLSKEEKTSISDAKNLEDDIFIYAKKNLAVVNVYIKDPVVTRIMRDQAKSFNN